MLRKLQPRGSLRDSLVTRITLNVGNSLTDLTNIQVPAITSSHSIWYTIYYVQWGLKAFSPRLNYGQRALCTALLPIFRES